MTLATPSLRRSATMACLAAACIGAAAQAAIVPITSNSSLSTENLGTFIGTLNYTFLGGTNGKLDVSLTNTTPVSTGGYITAFMFRPPAELGAFTSVLTASDYAALTNIVAGASGAPFPGTWLGGAGTGGSWLAGGSPTGGVPIGSTGNWSFTITGANASQLTSDSFVSGDKVSDPYAFIVRFRGLTDGGSDKVPANQLPSPGAVALLGLSGFLSRRRRD
jgi:MYXO-CTERM domain-containing protein